MNLSSGRSATAARKKRPASARDLIYELEACADSGAWSEEDARVWWQEVAGRKEVAAAPTLPCVEEPHFAAVEPTQTEPPTLTIDMERR